MGKNEIVRRVYVVKRPGFDIEATGLAHDLKDNLGVAGLKSVRIFNRYDVTGLSDDEFVMAQTHVLSEPPVDDLFVGSADFSACDVVFAVEALPGQYDQRADSAAQCIQLMTCGERPVCKAARVYALQGKISSNEIDSVKRWLINPVESREADMAIPATLDDDLDVPADIESVAGFITMDDNQLGELLQQGGFAMSLADLQFTRSWFQQEQRDPSWTELRVLDTYWSDHCRHTTFLTQITDVQIPTDRAIGKQIQAVYDDYLARRTTLYQGRLAEKPVCLMDLATLAMKQLRRDGRLKQLDESEEINACSIRVTIPVDGQDQDYLVLFKNETHNHPTEIEPFGGAATCLGGAIRDPLSGRSYVYQAMRVTGSGDPTVPVRQTLPGKLPQRKITTTAAAGYSSYGNQIGLATGQVDEVYHPGYIAKRMEIGAVIAAAPAANVRREVPLPGDVVVLLGGRTGRDGCGGATGSSKAHTEESIAKCGSEVQKGNPPTERKIQRLFRNPDVSHLIKRCNDFGAGGVSVAIGELSAGLRIDLDRVPRKYEGLDGTELAISESQERMAVVVAAEDAEKMIAAAATENLEAVVVAEVTAEPRMVMLWRGQAIVDLARAFIDTNGAPQSTQIRVELPDERQTYFNQPQPGSYQVQLGFQDEEATAAEFPAQLAARLASLNACSRKGLSERFDSTIGAGTVLMPFGGRYQLTPEEGMAALIPVLDGKTDMATLMTYGFDADLSSWSPFHGAYYAVAHSLAKITALGGDHRQAYLTFQEYFERLTRAEKWGKPLAALLGAFKAQLDFGVAAIGGKDSMSGSFMDLHVPPTLVSFAVAIEKANRVLTASLQKADQTVILLPVPVDHQHLPIATNFLANLELVRRLHLDGQIAAASTVHGSGLAVAVCKMCFGEKLGFVFTRTLPATDLFRPQPAAILVAPTSAAALQELLDQGGVVVGCSTHTDAFIYGGESLTLGKALTAWENKLEKVFPTRAESDLRCPDLQFIKPTDWSHIRVNSAKPKPRVFIPVFPGTNCEYDSSKAFTDSGAEVEILVVRNRTPDDIAQTLSAMERAIGKAQIVMLPGGFSGGDEPEGSGKFIAAALRNPAISEQIRHLLKHRDGLMLGICNGFQALVKLGLLPYGDIVELTADSPTLTFNRIGRHVSSYVITKIADNRSPWLMYTQPGDLHQIPVSHGEGRFAANPDVLKQLIENRQIATQYVDLFGRPTDLTAFNPNGSIAAIEGIISPDGRIFGKMGHSERRGDLLARNIPGEKDQKLFAAGVAYFHD
jgi:phosphoribosylformylglycinamidine synthase